LYFPSTRFLAAPISPPAATCSISATAATSRPRTPLPYERQAAVKNKNRLDSPDGSAIAKFGDLSPSLYFLPLFCYHFALHPLRASMLSIISLACQPIFALSHQLPQLHLIRPTLLCICWHPSSCGGWTIHLRAVR
jgi:hypothetical protein